jgi:2-polyprenyl-3-methyl-5-hydroxy-6-metoxy-1,4-benzoquinol methylase
VFVYPYFDLSDLHEHYNDNYYKEWLNTQKEGRDRMWRQRLGKLERFQNRGRLLDVGCGEGTFLQLAQKNGWQVSGTEVSLYAAGYTSNLLKVDIFCGELPDSRYLENSFDVVTMWHVLEHVMDPHCYLTEIHRILKPNGLLLLAVPNLNNLVMQIVYRIFKRRKLKLFSKDEKEVHIYHFSWETIKSYLEKTEFDCLSIAPDFGIIDYSKKIVNTISIIPYYLFGAKIFNAIEIFAVPKKG